MWNSSNTYSIQYILLRAKKEFGLSHSVQCASPISSRGRVVGLFFCARGCHLVCLHCWSDDGQPSVRFESPAGASRRFWRSSALVSLCHRGRSDRGFNSPPWIQTRSFEQQCCFPIPKEEVGENNCLVMEHADQDCERLLPWYCNGWLVEDSVRSRHQWIMTRCFQQ